MKMKHLGVKAQQFFTFDKNHPVTKLGPGDIPS